MQSKRVLFRKSRRPEVNASIQCLVKPLCGVAMFAKVRGKELVDYI